jgi:hypothetical protein
MTIYALWGITTTTLYNYTDLLIISTLRYFKSVLHLHILLPTFNSDKLVMSRENSKKFHLRFLQKRGITISATFKTRPKFHAAYTQVWPPTFTTLSDTEAALTHGSIFSFKGSRTTARRLSLWRRWRRRSTHWHWPFSIHIVSSCFYNPFLSNGGSVHHFCVAGDVEESNPLFDSRRQSIEKPFSLFVCSSGMRCRAYLDSFRNSAKYCSTDMFPCLMSWNSQAHCCHCARGKNRSLNSLLNLSQEIGTSGPNSSAIRTFVAFHQ